MGQNFSFQALNSLRSFIWNTKDSKMIMVGLDAAGKTTILFNLKLNEVLTTIPTIGFNVECIEYKNVSMTIWDIGGQDKIRKLWRHYCTGCNGIIYVVDSSDTDRLELAREELHMLLKTDELRDASLLVYANKQDLPTSLSAFEVADKLGLNSVGFNRNWYIQPACATTRAGLYEGLNWLSKSIK